MAIVRKSLDELMANPPSVDHAELAATTEADIRRHMIEDGQNPDASTGPFEIVVPANIVREKLGLSQEGFARALHIPIGTIRNWEQNRVTPDPAARALLAILYRRPDAINAIRAA